MSNTFDFNRFLALIRRQWIVFGRIYLMSLLVIAAVFVAFYGYNLYVIIGSLGSPTSIDLSFRPFLFILLGLAFMSIMASNYFSELSNKAKAIFELLLPTSRLEKFVVGLFYTVFLSLLSYVLIFALVDWGFMMYIRSFNTATVTYISPETGKEVIEDQLAYFFTKDYPEAINIIYLPFVLNALFLLGSISFKNFNFIKTAACVSIYVAGWIFIILKTMKWLDEQMSWTMEGKSWIVYGAISNKTFLGDKDSVNMIIAAAAYLLVIILWIISYWKLKEKEV